MANGIGTLAEKSLHAGIKAWYGRAGDQFEVAVDGFVIDIVRGEQLIEIQTGNFGAMKRKLPRLLENHELLLLYPVAAEKWIVRQTAVGEPVSRRKSPKRGQIADVFRELVYIPHLLAHPNLTIGVLLTQQEEILRDDGRGSWRRKRWSIHDRRLLEVVSLETFAEPVDFLRLLPGDLVRPFTNKQLAAALHIRPNLAQRMTYTLRHAGALGVDGRDRNGIQYRPLL
jgi:hypothetical protein